MVSQLAQHWNAEQALNPDAHLRCHLALGKSADLLPVKQESGQIVRKKILSDVVPIPIDALVVL